MKNMKPRYETWDELEKDAYDENVASALEDILVCEMKLGLARYMAGQSKKERVKERLVTWWNNVAEHPEVEPHIRFHRITFVALYIFWKQMVTPP